MKDDGKAIEIRKKLNQTRVKLKIVQNKIKKYGALGKIPMGACMRVYREESSSSSDSSSSSSDAIGSDASLSSFGDSEKFEKKKNALLKKKKKSILAAGLVYQPKFAKVVKDSSKNITNSLNVG